MAEEEKSGQTVTINDKEYAYDSLSETAKKQLVNIRVVDAKVDETNNQLAILQAARKFYASILEKELG